MNWIQQRREAGRTEQVDAAMAKARAASFTIASRNFLEAANGDEDYALWMMLVDQRLGRMVGLGLFDLADWPIADAFESGASPREAALEALRNDDTFPDSLFEE